MITVIFEAKSHNTYPHYQEFANVLGLKKIKKYYEVEYVGEKNGIVTHYVSDMYNVKEVKWFETEEEDDYP